VDMNADQIQRVIGYVRVSSEDQGNSGSGLAAQRRAIETEVAAKGWELVGEIRQDVMSGKSLNGRHELRQALVELKARKADALVVSKLDRLARSLVDFGSLLEASRRQKWHLIMLDLGGVVLDTSTPMGWAMANMAMTFAEFERRAGGLRTKEALAVRRSIGVGKPGGLKAPLGRPSLASPEAVKFIRARRRAGDSFQAIAGKLTAKGIPTPMGGPAWAWGTVRKITRRAKPKTEGRGPGRVS
jgi:DNA invertase Pin-like site-specific DNA recombinase